MPKAECYYCGDPTYIAKHGLIYLHVKCFEEITDMNSQIKYCIKYAKGELPKLRENGDRIGYESFKHFLISMQDFQRRWKNTSELIKRLQQTSSIASK